LNLENKDLDPDRRNLRLMLKITYAACPRPSQLISAQFAFEMCLATRKRQKKSTKPLFWRSKSSKIIEFGANQDSVLLFISN